MSINWQSLRPWNGSQYAAFEELCCQLARYESVPPDSSFVRKGFPDAGIECFWKLPGGDEWGWQAKFFLSPPNTDQWRQIDDSVRKSLNKHPSLTRLFICLPIDRQDPHIEQQKWFMDNWSAHVEKWTQWAKEHTMSIEFNYWGEHEIWERLSREEHRGRHFFWFNRELFSQQWLKSRIDEALANVGPRYSPELNVELPTARLFDGLGRTSEFYDRLQEFYHKIKTAHSKARPRRAEELVKNIFDPLRESVDTILATLESIERLETSPIDFHAIVKLTSRSRETAWECIHSLENAAEEEKKKATSLKKQQGSGAYNGPEIFRYECHYLYELTRELAALEDFAQNNEANLANTSALLLLGNAGIGKTHLFCDVASRRINAGLPTLLLLGGQFSSDEPWSQILRLLGLSCSREEFLGALEAAAQARGAKAIILIDALNEGEGRDLWIKYLAGMLTMLSRYTWIGIAVSVRISYEMAVIPDGLVPHKLILEVHHGFADDEYAATRTFFDYYGIERPSVPLLVPEFQNPLFLKLFCIGLKNLGLTRAPSGYQGITSIFRFFIESINDKLSQPDYLDFDPKSLLIQKVVIKLAEMMADKDSRWLEREEAQAAVDSYLTRNGYENTLFRHLISEGLLAEGRFRIADDKWCEGVHFSYERFTDHIIAKHLLDKHFDVKNPSHSFLAVQPLGSLLKDERECWRNRGLIEAFSIQLPELVNKELAEVAPESADYRPIREAFVESLVWRDPRAITDATRQYINTHVARYKDTHDQFLNALLTIGSNPAHPYNAEFLHKHLMKLELAERDAWWSIFLHYQYGERGAVDRLVDWAWSEDGKSHIGDEPIRLCGIALAWFLTTANRFLRDGVTKALVALLTKRIHILRAIIGKFLNVNDPYILERLFAAAYGCSMRSLDKDAVRELAKDVYDWIFKNGTPPPHILLRDYARGVIEIASCRGITLNIDFQKIRPPYKSEWPSFEIPSEKELKKYGEWQKEMPDEEWARVHLYESVMGFEDFSRYIIGTNFSLFEWTSRRLGEPRKPSRKEVYEAFLKSLTGKQKKVWDHYHTVRLNVELYRRLDQHTRAEVFKREFTTEELDREIEGSEGPLRRMLGKKNLKIFDESIFPYLNDPNPYKDEYLFDLSIIQRWMLKKVLDLGWTVERFGQFDRNVNRYSYGRGARKPERIGKKYQWIAYHECLARISDNFEMRRESWSDQSGKYEGPWQVGLVRDIDPSCQLKRTKRESWKAHTYTWWFPVLYDAWDSEPDDLKWLRNSSDLPAIEPLLEVTNPENGSRWLVLNGFYRWEQPTLPGEERFEIPRRDIWYILKSYIVKKSDMDELFEWAKKQNFMGRWMPESRDIYSVFLGEAYWAPAYSYISSPFYGYKEWTRGDDNRIPKKVLVTAESYLWEIGYDCSIDETITVYLPCKWIADQMGLRWNAIEGYFFDHKGNLIAFDPSTRTPGPGSLLIQREALLNFLTENSYDIFWTILGEKNIIGGWKSRDGWKGRLELSGAFRIYENNVEGITSAKYYFKE